MDYTIAVLKLSVGLFILYWWGALIVTSIKKVYNKVKSWFQ